MTSHGSASNVFVTVGSTKFTQLVRVVLSAPFLDAISRAATARGDKDGATLKVQFGATPIHQVLFDEKLGLQSESAAQEGSLPIRLLSNRPEPEGVEASPTDLANSLSPDAIKAQATSGQHVEEDQHLGLKHLALDWQASHGVVHIELIDYVASIGPYLQEADVVVCHAGSGTILEALRMEKVTRPPLIVVPNESLMNNHQTELAKALSKQHYVYASRLKGHDGDGKEEGGQLPALLHAVLVEPKEVAASRLVEFPAAVPGRFQALMDEEMGFLH